jgi:hypothetical protein
MIEISKITIGKGRIGFATGTRDSIESIGFFSLGEGLEAGESIPEDHPKELFLVLDFLNLEGLEQLEITLSKIRSKLEKKQLDQLTNPEE